MSKVLTFFFILFSLLSLGACGKKLNSKGMGEESRAYVEAALLSKNCGGEKVKEIGDEILLIERETNSLVVQYQDLNSKELIQNNSLYPELILSESVFIKAISDIHETIKMLKKEPLSQKEFLKLKNEVNSLKNKYNRWSFHQCHLTELIDNNAKKINDFIELEGILCKENCVASTLLSRDVSEIEMSEMIVSVCSLSERKKSCKLQLEIASIYGYKDKFIKQIMSKAKEFYEEDIYGLKKSPLEIECKKSEKYEITIPVYQNENSLSLMNAISENWKSENIDLAFKLGDRGVRLELIESGLSRVHHNNLSTIYLNKNISGAERGKTIAHEFGHTLGFNDCYVEYFDSIREEIIYYELDQDENNLMCSLGLEASIPKKYLEKVISKYCE